MTLRHSRLAFQRRKRIIGSKEKGTNMNEEKRIFFNVGINKEI